MRSRDDLRRALEDISRPPGSVDATGRRDLENVVRRGRARRRRDRTFLAVGVASAIALVGIVVVSFAPADTAGPASINPAAAVIGAYTHRMYVVDPESYKMVSRVLAVDPDTGDVARIYDAGYDPAVTLSPDGHTLYVASADPHVQVPGQNVEGLKDTLSFVDTQTGEAFRDLDIDLRTLHTGMASTPTMAVSDDGRWLYYTQVGNGSEGDRPFSVATVDTQSGTVLPESASVDQCGDAGLLPLPNRTVAVVCTGTNDIRIVQVADSGAAASTKTVSIPDVPDDRVDSNGNFLDLGALAWAALTPDASSVYVVSQNGVVFTVDVATGDIAERHDLGLPPNRVVDYGRVLLSPDGSELFLGTGRYDDFDVNSDQVVVVDTSSWDVEDEIPTSAEFWSMQIAPGGTEVWAIDKNDAKILVVDPAQAKEKGTFTDIGDTPELAAVPFLGRT